MTYLHVQQLAMISDEFDAVTASLLYLQREWTDANSEPETRNTYLHNVRLALSNVETTYILRAFIKFEALLKEHLEARKLRDARVRVPYRTEDLINSVARKQRPRISDTIRDQAHSVREYRNAIVHSNSFTVPTPVFQEALSYLNQFLNRVEDIS